MKNDGDIIGDFLNKSKTENVENNIIIPEPNNNVQLDNIELNLLYNYIKDI